MEPIAYIYTALVTLLIVLVIFATMAKVGMMRAKHKVLAPTTTGPDEFNNAFRVQQNTLEQAIMFLPVLWIFAMSVSDVYAGIAGAIWAIGRLVYAIGYWQDPEKRSIGFAINFLVFAVLLLWALVAVLMVIF